jgi:CDGSH-type Zn-finger protein
MTKVKIMKYDEGPFVVVGDFELIDGKGNAFQVGETIALCRCGQSQTQPFCDGAHRACGFTETSAAAAVDKERG